jgi:hypothetical protein
MSDSDRVPVRTISVPYGRVEYTYVLVWKVRYRTYTVRSIC